MPGTRCFTFNPANSSSCDVVRTGAATVRPVPQCHNGFVALADGGQPPFDPGLCAHCRYMRIIRSDRGSIFYLCGRAATDPSFPKYPRLPVLVCSGYEAAAPPVPLPR